MIFKFLIPGKCREDYLNDGTKEYLKRLSKYAKVSLISLPEEPLRANSSSAERKEALKREAERALKQIKEGDEVFLFDVGAKEYTSQEFAEKIKEASSHSGTLVFLFGSSYGLDDSLRERADVRVSLSKLTFTHYMALFLASEQIYRACKINAGESYDK